MAVSENTMQCEKEVTKAITIHSLNLKTWFCISAFASSKYFKTTLLQQTLTNNNQIPLDQAYSQYPDSLTA